jgi:vacuolar-type H+-ATPase subunit C/Vma6
MTLWDDLNARAHGLSTHLLGRAALEHLARSHDLPTIAAELERRGYRIEEGARASATGLELAARRAVAERVRILEGWSGWRRDALAIVFEDEDRRSIASLLRGAVQHAPPELRLSGLLPTPLLPERALEELSRQPSVGAIAALLTAWRHPLAAALVPETGGAEPDLLGNDVALNRAFTQRALRNARRAGDRGLLTRYVRRTIDIENAFTVLALSDEKPVRLPQYWVAGGRDLTPDTAERAVTAANPSAAGRLLAEAFHGTRLAKVFARPAEYPEGLEAAVLRVLIEELRSAARADPLSPAFFLGYALRLRAEVLDIRRIIWGVALRAPAATLAEGLVSTP